MPPATPGGGGWLRDSDATAGGSHTSRNYSPGEGLDQTPDGARRTCVLLMISLSPSSLRPSSSTQPACGRGCAPFVLLLRPNRSSYAVARRLVLVSLLIFSSTSPSIFMRRSSGEVCSIIFFFLGRFEGTESERDFDPLGDLFFYNHFHQSSSNQRNQQGFIFLFYSLRPAKVVSFSSTLSVPQRLFV